MEQPYFLINSVTRTLDILEYLSKKGEAGVSEVTKYLGVNKSTAHRFLASMRYAGYVEQNELNQKYKLSLKVFQLGNRVIEDLNFMDIAKPLMYELADKTGETINLGIIDKLDIVYIDKVLSKKVLRTDSPIGGRDKIHATALGKAMIAFYPENFIERYIRETGLPKITEATITDRDKFIGELDEIRKNGFSIDLEEVLVGLMCVAAPIFNRDNRPIAAISISAVKDRMNQQKLEDYKEMVLVTCNEISNQLGCPHQFGVGFY